MRYNKMILSYTGGLGALLFSKEDLRKLLVPLMLEQLLAVTIGMMDTMMVANCGEAAVSGISLVDSISVLFINMFSALATGGAVVASQYLGRKERENASIASKQLFYTILLVSTSVMVIFLAMRYPLLNMVFGHIDADVMESAQTYFWITTLSYPFLAMYNASAALLRAMGNAKASLYTSLVMNIVNIVGNAVLIYVVGMGVAGAAVATLTSRIIGAFVIQHTLSNPHNLIPYPVLHKFEWRGDMVKRILTVGVPTGLESSFFQFGKLVLLRMISTFGTASIAANAVANSLTTLQVLPGNAIGLAMVAVVGRCIGAKEFDQVRYYVKKLMLKCYAYMGALNIVMLLCTGILTGLYHLTPEADTMARQIIMLHGVGCIFLWPMSFVLPNALRAANDARFTMTVSCFSMVAFRIVFGFLLAKQFGYGVVGVWMAMQIDWVFRIICFVWRFKSGAWEKEQLI